MHRWTITVMDEARRLRDELAALPHYHVVAQNHDWEVIYSDGFTWPGALGFATDLITPTSDVAPEPGLEAVWIVEGDPTRCPLAHGDGVEDNEVAAQAFLEQATSQPPYWSAPLA
jgi:hypothetical protein